MYLERSAVKAVSLKTRLPAMAKRWRDQVLGLFEFIDLILENLKALTLKLFELVSLIYFLYKIVQHH
jgi:hypothetical protein